VQASQQEGNITTHNVAVAIVGKEQSFTMLDADYLSPFVAQMEADRPADEDPLEAPPPAQGAVVVEGEASDGGDGPAPMDT
jgi:hypothetical protein